MDVGCASLVGDGVRIGQPSKAHARAGNLSARAGQKVVQACFIPRPVHRVHRTRVLVEAFVGTDFRAVDAPQVWSNAMSRTSHRGVTPTALGRE